MTLDVHAIMPILTVPQLIWVITAQICAEIVRPRRPVGPNPIVWAGVCGAPLGTPQSQSTVHLSIHSQAIEAEGGEGHELCDGRHAREMATMRDARRLRLVPAEAVVRIGAKAFPACRSVRRC